MDTNNRTYDIQPDKDLGTTVLIVDDEEAIRDDLSRICGKLGITPNQTFTASNLKEAFKTLATIPIHVIFLDKNLDLANEEKENGIESIPEMLRFRPNAQILVISSSTDSQDIVEAMRLGAFGYVTKNGEDDLLVAQINKALTMAKLTIEKARLEKSQGKTGPIQFVANSKATKQLLQRIPIVAETDRPVLLLGEPGTGKTEVAELIHEYRKKYLQQDDRPFFTVNIPSLSPTMIERELFGNEPRAFTGADGKLHQGFFELANNGTIFLDEIGEISPKIQTKLLTILQKGTFYRVGGNKQLHTSFKLICATNRDLKEMVAKKQFREDLYWRISAFQLHMPSLNERKEDIPGLIRSILPRMCKLNRKYVAYEEIPKDFIDYVSENPPLEGNIRGLENQITYLLTLTPRDKKGRPILKAWSSVREIITTSYAEQPQRDAIRLNELLNLPFNVVGPDFPGLQTFLDHIQNKVLQDAAAKFRKNKDIARVLKLSQSGTCTRLKKLRSMNGQATQEVAQWN